MTYRMTFTLAVSAGLAAGILRADEPKPLLLAPPPNKGGLCHCRWNNSGSDRVTIRDLRC